MNTSTSDTRSVFVVHGRNEALRKAMFDFLRSINLSPMEWTSAVELTGEGSPYIGQVLDAAFEHATAIIVLMTPDEVAYLQPRYGHADGDVETLPAPQARPNVLFEAGMALGRDAKRTVLVEIGEVRPFSDVAGRHAIRLTNSTASRQALAVRLKTAGCDVDLTGTDWHTTGDFTAPPPPGDGLTLGRRLPSSAPVRKALDFDLKYFNKGRQQNRQAAGDQPGNRDGLRRHACCAGECVSRHALERQPRDPEDPWRGQVGHDRRDELVAVSWVTVAKTTPLTSRSALAPMVVTRSPRTCSLI